ncbi:septal ring lytic transglycosylase RlpA family protein [Thermaurantiacus sp.]
MRSTPSLLVLLLVAACARVAPPPRPVTPAPAPAAPAGVKLGAPYEVFGKTYVPADDRTYAETGIASWYGPGFHALRTANGETYDEDALTAAHRTLPMPSWVEVTNLDNGRSLVVRINDRGPFVEGRIIDLSKRSAELLGVDRPGLARVRVVRVFPEGDWARTTPPLLPAGQGQRPPGRGTVYLQVAALADAGRAQFLAQDLADIAPGSTSSAPGGLWRVRLGPFASEAEAQAARTRLAERGFPHTWIVRS